MGKYSVGLETKKKILDECKILFYEKGFEGTSFQDISDKAGVNKGLLPYHFKTKNNIAKEIYFEFSRNQRKACAAVLREEDSAVFNITSLMLFYKLIIEDDKLKRFWYDIAVSNVIDDPFFWENEIFLKAIVKGCNVNISEDELFTIYCIENGMEIELIKNICRGTIKEPIYSALEKQYTVTLSLLGFSREECHDIIKKSAELSEQIEVANKGYFEVEYRRKEV